MFESPVNDPVFAAHVPITHPGSGGGNVTWYLADFWVSVIGCTDQHQVCNPNNGRCTPLTGSTLVQPATSALDLSPQQTSIMKDMTDPGVFTNIYEAVFSRGQGSLRAKETVSDLVQAPLPDTQWMIEVSSWFALGLARLQRTVVEYATGPANILPGSYIQPPSDAASKSLCSSQKVLLTDGTISFSVLALTIILVVGSVIIITSLIIAPTAGFSQRKLHRDDYTRVSWALDSKFQLQRMAFEEAEMGTWHGVTDPVPVTNFGQKFGGYRSINPVLRTYQKS
jgi:hypothetical protein